MYGQQKPARTSKYLYNAFISVILKKTHKSSGSPARTPPRNPTAYDLPQICCMDSEVHLARVQVHGRRIEEENWKQRKRKRKNLPPEKQVVAVLVASWLQVSKKKSTAYISNVHATSKHDSHRHQTSPLLR